MSDSKSILANDDLQLPTTFNQDNLDNLVSGIEEEARSFVFDMSKAKDRKECASIAYKVARSKTTLDKHGAALVKDIKAKAKAIDTTRKSMRDRMDALKEKVRQPLTEWEQAEEQRQADIQQRIAAFKSAPERANPMDAEAVQALINELSGIEVDASFAEFSADATSAKEHALQLLDGVLAKKQLAELQAKQAETDRIAREEQARIEQEEQAKQARIAHDKAIAEKAKADAEAQAKAERERLELEKIKAEQAAEQAQAKAEFERKESERRAKEAAEAAKREAERKEQQRLAAEQAEIERKQKQAQDQAHRAKIFSEALQDFTDLGVSQEDAAAVLELIEQNKISHVTINF